jgi:hypothetical protein
LLNLRRPEYFSHALVAGYRAHPVQDRGFDLTITATMIAAKPRKLYIAVDRFSAERSALGDVA